MTDTPPDWVLIEAAKRSGWENGDTEHMASCYEQPFHLGYRALCDMIWKYEQQPVDRKLLCAREAQAQLGYEQNDIAEQFCIRAIELWNEGFGRD